MTTTIENENTGSVTITQPSHRVTIDTEDMATVTGEKPLITIEQPTQSVVSVNNQSVAVIPLTTTRIIEVSSQGPRGPRGYTNDGSNDFLGLAGSGGLQAYQIVYIDSEDTLKAANSNNSSHCGRVVGITTETAIEGEEINIRAIGKITNTLWDLTPGVAYYLSTGGEISTDIPLTGFFQRIGRALNSTTLIVELGEPVIIN